MGSRRTGPLDFARVGCALALVVVAASVAHAQSLGTFRWQLQPYCNAIVVNVTQQGSVYSLDGYDDQCGGPQRAPVTGTATPNPDGTIGLGLNIVTVPGGRPVQVDARITLPAASGSWVDSVGSSGAFVLGGTTAGAARALPAAAGSAIPAPFSLLTEGGFVARGVGGTSAIPATGSGVRMMWYPQQAAFRAGGVQDRQWDAANVGFGSAAFGGDTSASGQYGFAAGNASAAIGPFAAALGLSTTASGYAATALGQNTLASGQSSTALGSGTVASGVGSLAVGTSNVASGVDSVALGGFGNQAIDSSSFAAGSGAVASGAFSRSWGFNTVASGVSSTALGVNTTAAGLGSIALGTFAAAAAAAPGSFVFGDRSTTGGNGAAVVTSVSPNQFLVRAAGGTVFWSTSGTTYPTSPGVILYSGDSAWSSLSDVNAKENFRDLSNDDVLARIAAMPVREWNYKAQDQAIRHLGPTAQDFHAAFGLGQDERRINTLDADGVALAAIKALEARTRADHDTLQRENEALRAELRALAVLVGELRVTRRAGRQP
ncbi:MAG: tail fiber domain-containing protein [Acidobacteriota bacterium]